MINKDQHEIIKVKEVREEYAYIQDQTCEKCGLKGTYKMEIQHLIENEGIMHDLLECRCTECGNEKKFMFNVAAVFDKYKDMFGTRE